MKQKKEKKVLNEQNYARRIIKRIYFRTKTKTDTESEERARGKETSNQTKKRQNGQKSGTETKQKKVNSSATRLSQL